MKPFCNTAMLVAALFSVLVAQLATASAARPLLADEATYRSPTGEVLVHYATTGIDAPATIDSNGNSVPDFVEQIERTASFAMQKFIQLGFARPLKDGVLGGDDRIDIYLRNVQNSDGNAGTDSCLDNRCVGFAIVENDFAGFNYVSITEAVESVVPHELFHLIQYTYSAQQSTTWSEGSAVWAVEHLYGTGNSDMERFLPAFVSRTFRPFERDSNGFGDAYPYGAALWPYFLEQEYGPEVVLATWQNCTTQPFLKAHEATLAPYSVTIDQAWTMFTRWNAHTGSRASVGDGYVHAASYPEAPLETPIILTADAPTTSTIFVEGLSARYVPLRLSQPQLIQILPGAGTRVVAVALPANQPLTAGRELTISAIVDGEPTAAPQPNVVPAGDYLLVITGLSRNTIATAVAIKITTPPSPPKPPDSHDTSGCQSAGSGNLCVGIALICLLQRRSRKSRVAQPRRGY